MRKLILPFILLSFAVTAQNNFPTPSGEVRINNNTSFGGSSLSLAGRITLIDNDPTITTDNPIFYVTESGVNSSGPVNAEFAFFAAGPGSGSTHQGPYFFLRGNNYTRNSTERGMIGLFAGNVTNPLGDDGKVVLFSHADVDIRTGGDASSNGNKLVVKTNGNIGVGTNSPQSKLSVKGNVESQEIQVKTNVADYVFSSEYQRMSLEELESFIKLNNHLPRIQTQKDVDENRGLVKLGELSVSLMEKVEELTLHLIEMNNRLKIVEEENRILKEKLN